MSAGVHLSVCGVFVKPAAAAAPRLARALCRRAGFHFASVPEPHVALLGKLWGALTSRM